MPEDGSVHKPPSLELTICSAKRLRPRPTVLRGILLTRRFCAMKGQLKLCGNLSTRGPISWLRLSVDSASQVYVITFENARFNHCSITCILIHSFVFLLEAFSVLSLQTQDLHYCDHPKVWFFFIDGSFS